MLPKPWRVRRALARLASQAWALGPAAVRQRRRFRELAGQFPAWRARTASLGDETLTTGDWASWQAALAESFDPAPPFGFLRDPTVALTMFASRGGEWLRAQLRELEDHAGPATLRRLLPEDAAGEPLLLSLRYRTSHNRVHHAYHLARFERATGTPLRTLHTVVEWGGGYGDLARLYGRWHGGEPTYVIVDLPLLSCLQRLYLATTLGPERVHLVGVDGPSVIPGKVNLVPVGLLAEVPPGDLFVSTWALSESTDAAERLVAERDWLGARHLLLAFSGGTLGEQAAAAGATVEPVGDFLPGANYAFR